MKNNLFIFIFIFISCSEKPKKVKETTIEKKEIVKDTLIFFPEAEDTLTFSTIQFDEIIENHPEFFKEYPKDPDFSYYSNDDTFNFDSEVGQDTYYTLYAYFLRQKNGGDVFSNERKQLIAIFRHINALFQSFEYGGTFFGHQYSRILGYAEYSIYLMPKEDSRIKKTYDITKQKELYIKSLRQLIKDESRIDNETLGKEKIEREKELNKIVDKLNELITSNFYLRRAQEFQYTHYEYH